MNMFLKKSIIFLFIIFCYSIINAQDTIRYTGSLLSNPDYHHGQLTPVIGVHNIQVLRSNREIPDSADGFGWTYNHGPNIAYWNNTFYVQFLSNPVGEHVPPGQVYIATSKDGYNWDKPVVAFPPYKIPDGTTKEGHPGIAKDLYAVLHQRMGFYVARNGKLLTLAYFGICLDGKDDPNDGKGIGRAVREIKNDGTFGQIYFIRYNSAWNEKNTSYPFYKSSKDKKFVEACDELLSKHLMMQQWVEEADRDDPLIPLKKQYKAFSFYHLPDGRVVGLWKFALTSISNDEGKTWEYDPTRAPGFVNKNAKIWGQKTSDNHYAIVYNPSQFRWPLAISTSNDGLIYNNLLLVNGEISTMRYGGNYKSYGPQYVRGIVEGNGIPPDGNCWVTYSMNKEDIWVSRISVPVVSGQEGHIDEVFNLMPEGKELEKWNIFSPKWAQVKIRKDSTGTKWLALEDFDNFDYAVAERVLPSSQKLVVDFSIMAGQNNFGLLHIELQDEKGNTGIRLIFDEEGNFKNKDGYNFDRMMQYEANREYQVTVKFDVIKNFYEVLIDGKREAYRQLFAPLHSIDRIVFRTGERRYYPTIESPSAQDFDVTNAGIPVKKSVYFIKSLKTYNF